MRTFITLAAAGLLTLLCNSCKKSMLLERGYFIFGQAFSHCKGDCASLLLLEDDALYADGIHQLRDPEQEPLRRATLRFRRKQLPAAQLAKAKALYSKLPDLLKQSGGVIAATKPDAGLFYLELKEKGHASIVWRLSRDPDDLPPEIRAYVDEMKRAILDICVDN